VVAHLVCHRPLFSLINCCSIWCITVPECGMKDTV